MLQDASPFPRHFYERDPRKVAPDLLGALLVHGPTVGRIVETEAYLAEDDPAAHAFRGKTPRTAVLFGPAGHAYVYRTRAHHCLNVAVQEEGVPGCVLIRAVAPVSGIAIMRGRRGDVPERRLTDGPGKLCQAFAIDMRHYGVDLTTRVGLAILDEGTRHDTIRTGPRVGISVARSSPLRYRLPCKQREGAAFCAFDDTPASTPVSGTGVPQFALVQGEACRPATRRLLGSSCQTACGNPYRRSEVDGWAGTLRGTRNGCQLPRCGSLRSTAFRSRRFGERNLCRLL